MSKRAATLITIATLLFAVASLQAQKKDEPTFFLDKKGKKIPIHYVDTDTGRWRVHDTKRPAPKVYAPPVASTQDVAGKAPSDAVVLFDGKNLDAWTDSKGEATKWILSDGHMESVKKSGPIKTKRAFGSSQLHVEFRCPTPPKGSGQGRGNSGVFLMDTYEIQVLDNYENATYPDGQCGALYGQAVPLVNVCRPPGQWQSFDIIFHQPTFKDGKVDRKARFTVFQNGVLIHDNVTLQGGTNWTGPYSVSTYKPHADKLPISLQDHGNPVRYRNIWIRELAD